MDGTSESATGHRVLRRSGYLSVAPDLVPGSVIAESVRLLHNRGAVEGQLLTVGGHTLPNLLCGNVCAIASGRTEQRGVDGRDLRPTSGTHHRNRLRLLGNRSMKWREFAEMHAAGKDACELMPLGYLCLQACGDCFEEIEVLRRAFVATR